MTKKRPATISEYIDGAPPEAQAQLRRLYGLLKRIAPTAVEAIKWGNPVFEEGRILFAFSAHRDHINFVPGPAALTALKKELAKHKTGKATLQIPYDQPLPEEPIRKLAEHRIMDVRENDARWM